MRTGKVKESVLRRSVLRQLHNRSEAGSPAYGEDAGILSVDELFSVGETPPESERFPRELTEETAADASVLGRIAMAVNPVEGWTLAAQRAVFGAVNSLCAAGAKPRAITVTVLMPEETQESQLKELMREIDALCAAKNLVLVAGHTAVSPYVSTLVLSVEALGVFADRPEQSVSLLKKAAQAGVILEDARGSGGIRLDGVENAGKVRKEVRAGDTRLKSRLRQLPPGCDIVVAGTVGREGAAMIAAEREKELLTRYAPSYIETARHLFDDGSMEAAAAILREAGAVRIHDCREGGVFAGFWELAAAGKVGLSIDLRKIPIRQHTIEVCEYFDLNPYMLRSGGTLLAVCENGARAVEKLTRAGIAAAVAGETTAGNDRVIRYDDEVRFLEPPKTDEYYKTLCEDARGIN